MHIVERKNPDIGLILGYKSQIEKSINNLESAKETSTE